MKDNPALNDSMLLRDYGLEVNGNPAFSRERLSEGFFKKKEVEIDLHIKDLLTCDIFSQPLTSDIFSHLTSSHI